MRSLPLEVTQELVKDIVRMAHLFTFEVEGATYRYTECNNSIYYNGYWYVSKQIRFENAGFTLTSQVESLTMFIDNIDKTFSDLVLAQDIRNKECQIERVYLDVNLYVIGSPIVVFPGYVDRISVNRKEARIEVVNQMIRWKTQTPKRLHPPTCPWVFKGAECKYDGILYVNPNSDISVQWTKSGLSYNYQNVDEHLACLCAGQTYLADSENSADWTAAKAFNEIFVETYGWASTDTPLPHWLRIQFATAKIVTSYMITCRESPYLYQTPKNWKFQGSNDGTSWDDIDVRNGIGAWKSNEKRIFDFPNTTAYIYYRIYITLNQSGQCSVIRELCLFGPSNQVNDQDYNYTTSTSAQADLFGFPNISIASDVTGIVVTVRVRAKQSVATARNLSGRIRVGGTDYDATGISPALSPTDYDFVWLVNPATGNAWQPKEFGTPVDLCVGGTASADATYGPGYEADKAFDDNISTIWSSPVAAFPHWLQYQLPSAKTVRCYSIYGHSNPIYMPTAWTLKGSNNGTDWTDIDSRSGVSWSASEKKFLNVTSPGSYSYYRLHMTAGGTTSVVIVEMELFDFSPLLAAGYSTPANAGGNRVDVEKYFLIVTNDIDSLTCDLTPERCVALNNYLNFGGFKYLPELSVKEFWWGAKQKVWTGPF